MECSISAMKTKMSADPEEMKNNIQDKISTTHDRTSAGQARFEERLTETPDKLIKCATAMAYQKTHILRDVSSDLQHVRRDIRVAQG
jgi:hypothetical protein